MRNLCRSCTLTIHSLVEGFIAISTKNDPQIMINQSLFNPFFTAASQHHCDPIIPTRRVRVRTWRPVHSFLESRTCPLFATLRGPVPRRSPFVLGAWMGLQSAPSDTRPIETKHIDGNQSTKSSKIHETIVLFDLLVRSLCRRVGKLIPSICLMQKVEESFPI